MITVINYFSSQIYKQVHKNIWLNNISLIIFIILPNTAICYAQDAESLEKNLMSHVYTLASDSMQGRGIGTSGIMKAESYLVTQFTNSNSISNPQNVYIQNFHLNKKQKNSILLVNGKKLLFNPWHFFAISGFNREDTLKSKLLFVADGSINVIKHITCKPKALAFIGKNAVQATQNAYKIHQIYGINTFLVALDDYHSIDSALNLEFELNEFALPNRLFQLQRNFDSLTFHKELNNDSITLLFCFPNVLGSLFNCDDDALKKQSKKIQQNGSIEMENFPQPEITCFMSFNDSVESICASNIVGKIEGQDTSKSVIVSAHYDHIGLDLGSINYGADDNASGIASLLEMESILKAKYIDGLKPRYTILFIAFTAEEIGLLGSEWYVNHPINDINKTIININLDMIGRWDNQHKYKQDYVYLLCAGIDHKKVFHLGKDIAAKYPGFEISKRPGIQERRTYIYGSDHYNFYKKGIPVANFFTGLHNDYHTPQDTPDKINFNNLTKITLIATQLTDSMANITTGPIVK